VTCVFKLEMVQSASSQDITGSADMGEAIRIVLMVDTPRLNVRKSFGWVALHMFRGFELAICRAATYEVPPLNGLDN
jgi:hypothetical protein